MCSLSIFIWPPLHYLRRILNSAVFRTIHGSGVEAPIIVSPGPNQMPSKQIKLVSVENQTSVNWILWQPLPATISHHLTPIWGEISQPVAFLSFYTLRCEQKKWVTFSEAFFQRKCLYFDWSFVEVCSYLTISSSIGLGDGLALSRHQAITWANVDQDLWHHMAIAKLTLTQKCFGI